MAVDHLVEIRELPYDKDAIIKGGEPLADYLYVLVRSIMLEQLLDLRKTVNALIDTDSVAYHYFGPPDPRTGEFKDGTWRVGALDGAFVKQKKVDGVWVTVTTDNL